MLPPSFHQTQVAPNDLKPVGVCQQNGNQIFSVPLQSFFIHAAALVQIGDRQLARDSQLLQELGISSGIVQHTHTGPQSPILLGTIFRNLSQADGKTCQLLGKMLDLSLGIPLIMAGFRMPAGSRDSMAQGRIVLVGIRRIQRNMPIMATLLPVVIHQAIFDSQLCQLQKASLVRLVGHHGLIKAEHGNAQLIITFRWIPAHGPGSLVFDERHILLYKIVGSLAVSLGCQHLRNYDVFTFHIVSPTIRIRMYFGKLGVCKE